jgi:hypothetical protein
VYVAQAMTTGTPYINIDQKTFISFKAIGRDISQKQLFTYHLDPADGNFVYHDSYMEQGEQKTGATMPNTMFFPHLKTDFGTKGVDSATYRTFNVRTGKVEDFEYHKVGVEHIELNNTLFEAVVVQEKDPVTGIITTYWIDRDSGLRLKMESNNGIRMYLSDITVMERLSTGNWDDLIFVRTNEKIGDVRSISSMRVLADLDAFPVPGLEDLNVDGQSFEGSITGNSLKGVFEVEHNRYNGKDALSFGKPHSFSGDIQTYLQPEMMIESDAPEIKELALRLTDGSEDFWEAATRLSTWVAEHIDGSIMFGTALETLHRGNGACGSQSMLMAALCRASGIPARVAWGCVYTPEYGGSFGHHAWSEIYAGEAGWIPIDVTFHETDFVDSGHIRLGIVKTNSTLINYRGLRILKYSLR